MAHSTIYNIWSVPASTSRCLPPDDHKRVYRELNRCTAERLEQMDGFRYLNLRLFRLFCHDLLELYRTWRPIALTAAFGNDNVLYRSLLRLASQQRYGSIEHGGENLVRTGPRVQRRNGVLHGPFLGTNSQFTERTKKRIQKTSKKL